MCAGGASCGGCAPWSFPSIRYSQQQQQQQQKGPKSPLIGRAYTVGKMSGIINDALQDNLAYLEARSNELLDRAATSPQEVSAGTFQSLTPLVQWVMRLKKSDPKDLNDKLLHLDKLQQLVSPFRSAIGSDEKLENLVLQYSLVSLYQIALTNLLQSTVPLTDQVFYWEVTSSSTWRKLLYSLQTGPQRISTLVQKVFKDVQSSPMALDVQMPHDWESTYRLLSRYKDLITQSVVAHVQANNIRSIYKFVGWDNKSRVRYLKVIIGAPLASVFDEVNNKKLEARQIQTENAKKLGTLLTQLPNLSLIQDDPQKIVDSLLFLESTISSTKSSVDEPFLLLSHLIEEIPQVSKRWRSTLSSTRRPSLLTRYWPTILITLLYGPSTVISVITNRDLIVQFIKTNLIDTIKGFWNNWILKPVQNIIGTIRHDDNSTISIMSHKSLDSDLESLKRMVIDYTVENTTEYKSLNQAQLAQVRTQLDTMVSTGDLTPMMREYEQDIKNPVKNLIRGRLPRALLIQLQKTKVDGALAMSGVDKLLKSQELVFGIVAASPSLLILLYAFRALNSYITRGYITKGANETRLQVSQSLNNIERLLSKAQDSNDSEELDYINGMLLLEIISLRAGGLKIIPKMRRPEWLRDVHDLANFKTSTKLRLNTITRLYHVYGTFFT